MLWFATANRLEQTSLLVPFCAGERVGGGHTYAAYCFECGRSTTIHVNCHHPSYTTREYNRVKHAGVSRLVVVTDNSYQTTKRNARTSIVVTRFGERIENETTVSRSVFLSLSLSIRVSSSHPTIQVQEPTTRRRSHLFALVCFGVCFLPRWLLFGLLVLKFLQ